MLIDISIHTMKIRRTLLVTSLHPSISICVLDDLIRNLLDISLDLSILELATDETLGGEKGVFGVDDSLTLCSDTN